MDLFSIKKSKIKHKIYQTKLLTVIYLIIYCLTLPFFVQASTSNKKVSQKNDNTGSTKKKIPSLKNKVDPTSKLKSVVSPVIRISVKPKSDKEIQRKDHKNTKLEIVSQRNNKSLFNKNHGSKLTSQSKPNNTLPNLQPQFDKKDTELSPNISENLSTSNNLNKLTSNKIPDSPKPDFTDYKKYNNPKKQHSHKKNNRQNDKYPSNTNEQLKNNSPNKIPKIKPNRNLSTSLKSKKIIQKDNESEKLILNKNNVGADRHNSIEDQFNTKNKANKRKNFLGLEQINFNDPTALGNRINEKGNFVPYNRRINKKFATKGEFSSSPNLNTKSPNYSREGFYDYKNNLYLKNFINIIAYPWFYNYVPTNGIFNGGIRPESTIKVRIIFDKNNNKSYKFISKTINPSLNQAVKKALDNNLKKVPPLPKGYQYKNVIMTFILLPLSRTENHLKLFGEAWITGEVEMDPNKMKK